MALPAASTHDPNDRSISKDNNNYLWVQISRIDGQTLVFGRSVEVNSKFQVGRFGLIVRVGGDRFYLAKSPSQAYPEQTFRIQNIFFSQDLKCI